MYCFHTSNITLYKYFYSVIARLAEDKGACEAQMLWAACQALARAVKLAPLGTSLEKSVRPLAAEIQAVRKAARKHYFFKTQFRIIGL